MVRFVYMLVKPIEFWVRLFGEELFLPDVLQKSLNRCGLIYSVLEDISHGCENLNLDGFSCDNRLDLCKARRPVYVWLDLLRSHVFWFLYD